MRAGPVFIGSRDLRFGGDLDEVRNLSYKW